MRWDLGIRAYRGWGVHAQGGGLFRRVEQIVGLEFRASTGATKGPSKVHGLVLAFCSS